MMVQGAFIEHIDGGRGNEGAGLVIDARLKDDIYFEYFLCRVVDIDHLDAIG